MEVSSDDPLLFFIMMIVLGIIGFFRGFVCLKKKRAIENIPTSTIRGMAMGTVEISGQAEAHNALLTAPLTGASCIYYKYKIEEERGNSKNRHWVTIASGDSQTYPFFINDGTSRVLVNPMKAEMILPHDLSTEKWDQTPYIRQFLQSRSMDGKGFWGFNNRRRFTEWHIRAGEKVYILGFAQKDHDFETKHRQLLADILTGLKNDKAALKKFDVNHDNEITQDEWTMALRQTEQGLIEKYMEETRSGDNYDTVIAYNPNMNMFIISDKSQKDLLSMLGWQVILFIWGGGALAVLGLFLTLGRFGIL